MLKRQETVLSSSSRRRETPPQQLPENHNARSIGCMASFLHLVSKYQRRRKFLITSGRNQSKDGFSTPQKSKPSEEMQESEKIKKISGDVTRSPMLPPEIRKPNAFNSSQVNLIRSNKMATDESTTEKRRKLLNALERCNQDLEQLKKIIDEHLQIQIQSTTRAGVGTLNPGKEEDAGNLSIEQPSPVSVLDDRYFCFASKQGSGRKPQQQTPKPRKKPGEEESISNECFFKNVITGSLNKMGNDETPSSELPQQRSRGMVETVDAVCKDISWGEKREVGRIGLELQDYICRELIEEVAGELGGYTFIYSLPLDSCKRRLCF